VAATVFQDPNSGFTKNIEIDKPTIVCYQTICAPESGKADGGDGEGASLQVDGPSVVFNPV
jgi:hypothetical protein